MECPYCRKLTTVVTNSRPTKGKMQVWRRRKCLLCKEIFTTHEVIDLSHLIVLKKSGNSELFSRMKLYSGIFYASQSSKIVKREIFIDAITRDIEKEILSLQKKKITSEEIATIVLRVLKKKHIATFLRYLTNGKDILNGAQLRRELSKYLSEK